MSSLTMRRPAHRECIRITLGAIHKGWFALPASFNVSNCADFRVIPTQTNPEASPNAGRDMTRAGYHLQTCPGESGVHFPSNDTDEKFVVDPDLRSHSEERPDPKTNPEPKREVVRARARGGASCGRGGAERHQRLLEVLVSSPKIKSRRRRAKKKRERPVARDTARGAGTRRIVDLVVDHL